MPTFHMLTLNVAYAVVYSTCSFMSSLFALVVAAMWLMFGVLSPCA